MLKVNWAVSLLLVLIIGCTASHKKPKPVVNENPVGLFPNPVPLSHEQSNTVFVTTLESELDTTKNAVYASTMLFCWEKFEKDYGQASHFSKSGLAELNKSRCFKNVLKADEYKTILEAEGDLVKITSIFDIQLPFREPLNKLKGEFKGQKIKTFGSKGGDRQVEIIYYNSDSDFALRLLPENNEHEIIVCQSGFSGQKSLKEQFLKIKSNEKQFISSAEQWKKVFNEEDEFSIPELSFNLETNYKTIEGATCRNKTGPWEVIKAYQQNAFVMNEKGATAFSKADLGLAGCGQPQEKEKTPVKRLNVKSNYVIFLKRKDSKWPYFASFVANSRWMAKLK